MNFGNESAAEAREAAMEVEANQQVAGEVLALLRTHDVTAETDDKGHGVFRLKDGRTIRGEAFGRGTVLSRSGVRLYEAVERPRGYETETEIVTGDFVYPREFARYVRDYITGMIERAERGSADHG